MTQSPPPSFRHDLANVGRGLLMGGADIVPGVSGGTVALILGIYERLVTAVSHFDLRLLALLRGRQFAAAAAHVDLRFLVALGTGIGVAIVTLASLMNRLLTQPATRPLTLAAFFGLILASTLLVAKMIKVRSTSNVAGPVLLAAAGAVFAYWLTGLQGVQASATYAYVFLCGALAICAMILPGISGAFILLILGMYVYVTGIIRRLSSLDVVIEDLASLACFAAGCAVGLILFSKLLRWLLARHEPQMMAVLCGFMLGSLRKIWPFKRETTLEHLHALGLSPEKIAEIRGASPADQTALIEQLSLLHRRFENVLPEGFTADVLRTAACAVAGAVLVLLLDRMTGGHDEVPPLARVPKK